MGSFSWELIGNYIGNEGIGGIGMRLSNSDLLDPKILGT